MQKNLYIKQGLDCYWILKMETFTDSRDNKTYKVTKIGSQIWMAENLDYTMGNSVGCYYENSERYKKYGRLYDWTEAMSIAPKGWHLPTKSEWNELRRFAIESDDNESKKLKSKEGWLIIGNGTDNYGFNALPGGYCSSDGIFDSVGDLTEFWSSTEYDGHLALGFIMMKNSYWAKESKSNLFSVRCIKN